MSHERKVRARIHGKVQGVWYRAWTTEEASELGLDGWVRNRADGTVEAVFAGPAGEIDRMVALLHEGPPLSRVDRVDLRDETGDVATGFEQRSTV